VSVRYSRGTVAAAVAMLGAAGLWGINGGIVSGLSASGAAAASTVELLTGVALTLVASIRGHHPRRTLPVIGPRLLLLLGLAEAVNVLCYYEALQLAPVGPVMALHLAAPILLTVAALARRRNALSPRAAVALALTAIALVLIALGGSGDSRHPNAVWGYLLSAFSAACLAFFVTGVGSVAPSVDPMGAAGAQMFVSGALLSPSLWSLHAHPREAVMLMVLGLCAFAPACWLYWAAMRRLTPVAASTILLAEPFFGTALATLAYAAPPTWFDGLAAAMIIVAVFLNIAPTSTESARSAPAHV
jgi:drug/metabolite transporter, DME family